MYIFYYLIVVGYLLHVEGNIQLLKCHATVLYSNHGENGGTTGGSLIDYLILTALFTATVVTLRSTVNEPNLELPASGVANYFRAMGI
jgi:hypothetical protein